MKQAILFLISLVVLSSPSYAQEFDDADSDFERKHESAAIALDRELAEFGDLTAQFNLAVAYEFGTGIEQDRQQHHHCHNDMPFSETYKGSHSLLPHDLLGDTRYCPRDRDSG